MNTRYLPHLSLPVGGKPPRALSWKHRSWSRPVKGLCRPQNYHCYLPGPWVTLQGATITTKGIKNLDASRWYVFVSGHLKESATRIDLCSFCLASYTTQGCHAVGRYIAWQPTLTLITIKPDENFASKSKVEEISKCCFVLLFFCKKSVVKIKSCQSKEIQILGATCTVNKVLYNWPKETIDKEHKQRP